MTTNHHLTGDNMFTSLQEAAAECKKIEDAKAAYIAEDLDRADSPEGEAKIAQYDAEIEEIRIEITWMLQHPEYH